MRRQLLALHRALLDAQRADFERVHGRVSSGAFLELVVGAPEFQWLRPMTALIVSLDEAIDAPARARRGKATATSAAAEASEEGRDQAEVEAAYVADVRALVSADLDGSEAERRYAEALQNAPEVVLAHGALMRALS
jgi:hypothetical protein